MLRYPSPVWSGALNDVAAPRATVQLLDEGMRLLWSVLLAYLQSDAFSRTFLHSASGCSTTELKDECCWGSFATLTPGLAEGLGRACFWQSHCLKLQEISWATVAARRWYDCSRISSMPAEWKLGLALWRPRQAGLLISAKEWRQ